jgi:hypothetical protein
MNPTVVRILKNSLFFIVSVFAGGLINGGIIAISSYLIPPPAGAHLTTEEGLKASMHLMQPIHFLMPFLAHALGTLAAAFLATKLIKQNSLLYALGAGLLFFIGGASMVKMLPAPVWFNITDLVGAYFPMAWLGWKLGEGIKKV